ncbi:hypothetical protein LINPERHAP1_LOCUS27204, partial [Linum perenne]
MFMCDVINSVGPTLHKYFPTFITRDGGMSFQSSATPSHYISSSCSSFMRITPTPTLWINSGGHVEKRRPRASTSTC